MGEVINAELFLIPILGQRMGGVRDAYTSSVDGIMRRRPVVELTCVADEHI